MGIDHGNESNNMRILHVNNIANVAYDLSRAQREMSQQALVLAHRRHSMSQPDVPMYLDGFVGINFELLIRSRLFQESDIVHIHGGIRRTQTAFRRLRNASQAKWVLHYHGSETRMGYGMFHRDLGDRELVSTPDLLRWHEGAEWLPNPIPEVASARMTHRMLQGGKIVVGHFPTNRELKGTASVVHALKSLLDSGSIELKIMERRPHHDIIDAIQMVDVVVDQLNRLSIFSKVALEAMAFGVPAISSYDPMLFPDDCPVLAVRSGAELFDALRKMCSEGVNEKLKGECIAYVRKYHHPSAVAQKLEGIYGLI